MYKGLIVNAKVDDIFDRLAPNSIIRIVVKLEDDNILAITHYNEMCAVIGYNTKDDEIIKEIEVPDDLIVKALALVKAEKEFNDTRAIFDSLLKSWQNS
ncbi:MAG: hypothetical protein WC606_03105 [Candidatus Absconditabacterales bacterium]|jgi:hypothetical protein